MRLALGFLILFIGLPAAANDALRPPQREALGRPLHTYSIVARDPETGELGVAVQSHWFAVGSKVAWAKAGVGAVATQSFIEQRYGASGLELMGDGWTAAQALAALLAADPNPQVRQVAMIDANGDIAVHTGEGCIEYAGHLVGEHFAVQANLMLRPEVPEAMKTAFLETKGSLAERMLAALGAAQAAGGDLRGKQSAAILVVRGEATGRPWDDRLVDLHVEDHPAPLAELERLLRLSQAYGLMNQGDQAFEQGDVEAARAHYGKARGLAPDNLEMRFWYAVTLTNSGHGEEALPIFAAVFRQDPQWALLIGRLEASGLLQADPSLVDRIESWR